MAHHRHIHIGGGSGGGGGGNAGGQFGDTTYTKIFVGGLAWETQRDTMRRYFEQFGEILEAVVITDKNTGRSKGYGFVTFKDPESARRACFDPTPVIDGRRANCNLAILGAVSNRSRPAPALLPQQGLAYGRFRQMVGSAAGPVYHGSSAAAPTGYFQQPAQYPFPYSAYGYPGGYTHENMYHMSYYNISGGQHQFSPFYPGAASGLGMYHNFYHPYYAQFSHSSNVGAGGSGGVYGLQYPQMLQYTYTPQQYATAIVSVPATLPVTAGVTMPVVTIGPSSSLRPTSAAADQLN